MRKNPAEKIVEFLGCSSNRRDALAGLNKLSPRAWRHLHQWLDDAGLAFYFLQKLKDMKATDAVPAGTLSDLQRDLEANQRRVREMAERFDLLNQKFNHAGVRYAAVKGLSLIPQFCSSASLRYQADFDYLVDSESLLAARQVLSELGYVSKNSASSLESIFLLPGTEPSRSNQYGTGAPHAVELHLDIWDGDLHRQASIPKLFSIDRSVRRRLNEFEFEFPALADEDAFLLQILHACHHIFTDWIRMSCLYEIAYFLNWRAQDLELWRRVEERVGDSVVLREFVVVVSEVAADLFAAPLPQIVMDWRTEIRPAIRLWIERYSRDWALCDLPVYQIDLFPTALLARFLRQQYRDEPAHRDSEAEHKTSPSWPTRVISSLRNDPSLMLDSVWWKRQVPFRRSLFHVMARLRYLCEIPRWRWLNRASLRSAPFHVYKRPNHQTKPGDFAEF